jgi:hypothetical protein
MGEHWATEFLLHILRVVIWCRNAASVLSTVDLSMVMQNLYVVYYIKIF